MKSCVTDTSDSMVIFKDGQIITGLKIIEYIDTLPDLLIVQRNISGEINNSVSDFGRVEAVICGENDKNSISGELF